MQAAFSKMEASRSFVVKFECALGADALVEESALDAQLEDCDCDCGGGDLALASVRIENCLLKGEMVSCILRKNLHTSECSVSVIENPRFVEHGK